MAERKSTRCWISNLAKRPVQLIVPMGITNTDDDIANNKDVNEPAKD